MIGPMLTRSLLLVVLLCVAGSAAAAPSITQREADKQRYDNCLSLANLDPAAALGAAGKWANERGGPPAQHCAAVALVGLKRYAEAAAKLDSLARAPGMGDLRSSLFDQAGNAWMLQGEISKAVESFQAALALSASDADLYADLARAQAMQSDWPEVESDLNAALAINARRPDLLVLRASARHAQNHIIDARADVEAALKLSPKNAEAMVERGSIRRDSGDLPGARQDFQTALGLGPAPETADAAKRNIAALDAASMTSLPKPLVKPKKK
ncbi:MAG TPA: tetratricopeptide repeat protein [Rhizomicrobium sp.]|jgi:tetratricopeptide (TPR) repeat protein|nr:tetratricopeptide repeat protein [Rhizomicrobium sp.]